MQDGAAARTDGVSIWVDDRLNEAEERCAVEHELVHIDRDEGTCQPEYIEMEVRYEAAARLLPLEKIVGVCKDGKDLTQIAAELGVTRRVLMDRAATLTRDQSAAAGCFDCLKCPSQAARMREMVNSVVDKGRELPARQPPQELVTAWNEWKETAPHAAADYDSQRHPSMLRRAVVAV